MADNAVNRRVSQDGRFRVGFFLRKIYQKNQKIWLAHCPDPLLTSVQAGVLTVNEVRAMRGLGPMETHGPRDPGDKGTRLGDGTTTM